MRGRPGHEPVRRNGRYELAQALLAGQLSEIGRLPYRADDGGRNRWPQPRRRSNSSTRLDFWREQIDGCATPSMVYPSARVSPHWLTPCAEQAAKAEAEARAAATPTSPGGGGWGLAGWGGGGDPL